MFPVSIWAVLLFCLMLWTATENAHGRQIAKRAEPVKEQCLPRMLNSVRVAGRPTEVAVSWAGFSPRRDCTKPPARYQIVVKWKPKDGEEQEKRLEAKTRWFDVTGLKPATPVTIFVSLIYIDASGKEYLGPLTPIDTSTTVDGPSAPTNFKLETKTRTAVTFVWEDPEVAGGPLDGFFYKVCEVKDCESQNDCKTSPLETPERHKLTLSTVTPSQHYRVEAAAYNILRLSHEAIVGNYSHACFEALPPSAIYPRDLEAECTANPNSLTLTWKLPLDGKKPESYNVYITGNTWSMNKDIDINNFCQEEDCKYSANGLKGGIKYQAILVAKDKDIGDDSAFTDCTVAESAPPIPTQDIQLVYDPQKWWWVTPKKTQQAFQFPVDIFSDINGDIVHVDVLVAQDSKIDDCKNPVEWNEANSHDPVPCYILQNPWLDGNDCRLRVEDQVSHCILGTQENCDNKPCSNGPLKVGVKYGLKLIGGTDAGRTESKPVFFTAGSPSPSPNGSSRRTGENLMLIGGILALTVFMIRP